MQKTTIPYTDTGRFSKLVLDYLNKADHLQPFYHRFPDLDAFEPQMAQKAKSFEHRAALTEALRGQYNSPSAHTEKLIERLGKDHCFTVCTGHQLCLFTGPLYFVYKIVSIINLADKLRQKYPGKDVIPVFWMASEDHDFDEINHLHLADEKISWESGQAGAVGRMQLDGIEEALDEVARLLGDSSFADDALEMLRAAYSQSQNLSEATRKLVHSIFGEEQLLVLDGDDPKLKSLFAPIMQQELKEQFSFAEVTKTSRALSEHYNMQVTPREINLFYLGDQMRERIVFDEENFKVIHTDISWTPDEMEQELEKYPERFSPNVVLRPLYQETVLPNLAYVGGGGELSYWFQLKGVFDRAEVPFPILMLRNSVMWITRAESKKIDQLDIPVSAFFGNREKLVQETVRERSEQDLSLDAKRDQVNAMFEEISERAASIDPTLRKMVLADGARTANSLNRIEKRLVKAEKARQEVVVRRIQAVFQKLFPGDGLQERHANFFEFYEKYGPEFLEVLFRELDPLDFRFTIIEEPNDQ